MTDLIPIRRFVDADNSCLFSSIGYLMEPAQFDNTTSLKVRQTVVNNIKINKKYDITILGQERDEYIEFIQQPHSWGGGTELKILSDIYQVRIIAIDVKTLKHYTFGEDQDFNKSIYVVHNGVHYDPLVFGFSQDSNTNSDITIFDANNLFILEKFKTLVKKYQKKGYHVESSDAINLECDICKKRFSGKQDATLHAQLEDHWNFNAI